MTGFAIIGSFAVVGLIEVSRRRELGLETSTFTPFIVLLWPYAFDLRHSPSSILALGLVLLVIFICWLAVAESLYVWLFGPTSPESFRVFLSEVLTTSRGWALIVLGSAIGFIFAVVALSISVVSFPLLLDRNVGVAVAVRTSVEAVLASPVTMALWGLNRRGVPGDRFLSAVGWPRVRGTDPRTCDLASLPQGRGTPHSLNDGFKMRGKALEDYMLSMAYDKPRLDKNERWGGQCADKRKRRRSGESEAPYQKESVPPAKQKGSR